MGDILILKMKKVIPIAIEGWSLSIFGNPKFKVKCGNCGFIFKKRINDEAEVICDYCHIINKLPLKRG